MIPNAAKEYLTAVLTPRFERSSPFNSLFLKISNTEPLDILLE
jgi:hypothetical protein